MRTYYFLHLTFFLDLQKIWYYILARLRITALNFNGLPTNIKVPGRKVSNRQFKLIAESAAIVNENGMFCFMIIT